MMEKWTGLTGKVPRMELVIYCPFEGKSETKCPLAKQIICQSSLEEKVLVVFNYQTGTVASRSGLSLPSWSGTASSWKKQITCMTN